MDSLQYGVAPKLPERNVELMVAELNQQRAKKQAYSRRCVCGLNGRYGCVTCTKGSTASCSISAPAQELPECNMEDMMAELKQQCAKKQVYSCRCLLVKH